MTPLQFSTVARIMYGEGWSATLSIYLGVNLRNVQHWAAGTKPVPPGVALDVVAMATNGYRGYPKTAARFDEIAEILRQITGAE